MEHIVKEILEGSIAQEMEIEPGDNILAVNDHPIEDIFDYQYLINDEYIELLVRKSDGEEWLLEIDKDYDEDLGIVFENSLMDNYKSCYNKCIFCFIDQNPKGMRDTIYFKDDDSRLSFLQGNYITLTNMKEKDIDRIINYHKLLRACLKSYSGCPQTISRCDMYSVFLCHSGCLVASCEHDCPIIDILCCVRYDDRLSCCS